MIKTFIEYVIFLLYKLHLLTPISIAKLKFLYKLHRWPNFKHPCDVNEKINWMKFYGDTSRWSLLADKYRVREYVKQCGYEDILIPLLGKWDSVDEIDWNKLPHQFVMKCNNGSGDVLICKDKNRLNISKTKRHFKKRLKERLSVLSAEPHYADIKPCIIAETLLDVSKQSCCSTSIIDYKVWVFNGKPLFIFCAWNRNGFHANVACYDLDWNFHPEWSKWTNHYFMPKEQLPRPKCLDTLIGVASKLGEGQPVTRVDLYICDDKVYFGEITMTSQGGYMDYFTQDFLNKMGELTILPIDKKTE